jgi:hypothetical protein
LSVYNHVILTDEKTLFQFGQWSTLYLIFFFFLLNNCFISHIFDINEHVFMVLLVFIVLFELPVHILGIFPLSWLSYWTVGDIAWILFYLLQTLTTRFLLFLIFKKLSSLYTTFTSLCKINLSTLFFLVLELVFA